MRIGSVLYSPINSNEVYLLGHKHKRGLPIYIQIFNGTIVEIDINLSNKDFFLILWDDYLDRYVINSLKSPSGFLDLITPAQNVYLIILEE